MKAVAGRRGWTARLDMVPRLIPAVGFTVAFVILIGFEWLLVAAVAYLGLTLLNVLLAPRLSNRSLAALRRGQIVGDIFGVTLVVHLTGSLTSPTPMIYPLVIFGAAFAWGVEYGRLARRLANYGFLALLLVTALGWVVYDPFQSTAGYGSHLEWVRNSPVWSALPEWSLFAAVALLVVGTNFLTFAMARHLIERRNAAERRAIESAGRRAVADVVSVLAGLLSKPLVETKWLLESTDVELQDAEEVFGVSLEDARADLDFSLGMLERMQGLVTRLETLVHLPTGAPGVISLEELVREVRRELVHAHGTRGLAVRVDADADLPEVRGDRTLLGEAIRNLLASAILASERSGAAVHVRVARCEAGVALECSQDGKWFDLREAGELFDPLAPAAERRYPDGLSLVLVREVVRQHRGDLNVDYEPGHGTIVRMRLPLAG